LDLISQAAGTAALGAGNHTGQSFTALTSGSITEIDVRSRTTTASATLYIYGGATGSGTPGSSAGYLYSQAVSLTDATGDGPTFGFSPIVLTTPFPVTAGSQYSFVIDGASLSGAGNNPYGGGTRLDNYATPAASQDLAFQVIESHTVSETGASASLSDYTSAFSGACNSNGLVSLKPGDDLTCTITNTFKTPKLTVTKVVVNTGGGTKQVSDFGLFVDSTSVTSGAQNAFSTGSHTVSETPDANYTSVISGDCASNGSVSLAAGDTKACTITNTFKAPTIKVTKYVVNTGGGTKNVG